MRAHVNGERLTTAQCVAIATREPSPVARLGWELLQARSYGSAQEREPLAGLADANCAAVARAVARWALGVLGLQDGVDPVSRFFDSPQREVREGAWEWFAGDAQAQENTELWGRFLETPYDELRLRVVEGLEKRNRESAGVDLLAWLWTGVLLSIHRGGKQKRIAVKQIAQSLVQRPGDAEKLMPVLGAVVRSVRPTEARPALAALVELLTRWPELEEMAKRLLPELAISPEEAAV
jgi:hypothetical protein